MGGGGPLGWPQGDRCRCGPRELGLGCPLAGPSLSQGGGKVRWSGTVWVRSGSKTEEACGALGVHGVYGETEGGQASDGRPET